MRIASFGKLEQARSHIERRSAYELSLSLSLFNWVDKECGGGVWIYTEFPINSSGVVFCWWLYDCPFSCFRIESIEEERLLLSVCLHSVRPGSVLTDSPLHHPGCCQMSGKFISGISQDEKERKGIGGYTLSPKATKLKCQAIRFTTSALPTQNF